VSEDRFALVMRASETMIRIAKVQDFTPPPFTVLGWEVSNIEEMVDWLQKRGVAFEKYPWIPDKNQESGPRPPATKQRGSKTRMETYFPSANISRGGASPVSTARVSPSSSRRAAALRAPAAILLSCSWR